MEPIRYELHGYLAGQLPGGPDGGPQRLPARADGRGHAEARWPCCRWAAPAPIPIASTPQELYELGKRHFEKKDWKSAGQYLTELVEKWNLKPDVYKEAVRACCWTCIWNWARRPRSCTTSRSSRRSGPDEEIPFAKIVKVGAAYHEMGEFERSYLVFRAMVEGSFTRESGVAGFLETQGEFLRSVDVMGRLLREYPPEGYVAEADYALAQQVYAEGARGGRRPQAAASRRSTGSTWCSGRGRCWKAS